MPVDYEAQEFIKRAYQSAQKRNQIYLKAGAIGAIILFFIFWRFISLNSTTSYPFIILFITLFPAFGVLIWFNGVQMDKLQKDMQSVNLAQYHGSYKKIEPDPKHRHYYYQKIKTDKEVLIVPVYYFKDMSPQGQAKIDYFPNTKWVWKIEDEVVVHYKQERKK